MESPDRKVPLLIQRFLYTEVSLVWRVHIERFHCYLKIPLYRGMESPDREVRSTTKFGMKNVRQHTEYSAVPGRIGREISLSALPSVLTEHEYVNLGSLSNFLNIQFLEKLGPF